MFNEFADRGRIAANVKWVEKGQMSYMGRTPCVYKSKDCSAAEFWGCNAKTGRYDVLRRQRLWLRLNFGLLLDRLRRFASSGSELWLIFGHGPFEQLLELIRFEQIGLPNEIVQDVANAF